MVYEIKLPDKVVQLNFLDGLTNQEFEELCFANKELIVEREPDGKITVMSPVSGRSGRNENIFNGSLFNYENEFGGGAFSSSTGYQLPDGSVKSPDASYLSPEKMGQLSDEDFNHFLPTVPDFVVEVVSPTDNVKVAMAKMTHVWIANGVRLGWLVDAQNDKLWIYRQNGTVDLVEDFGQTVSGEDVLPGFSFDLRNLM